MNVYQYRKTLLCAVALGTTILVGCGDDPVQTSGSSSSSGQGGNGGGGAGGNGGAGGEGGGMMAVPGKTGGAFVSAGHSIKSPKYRLVFTMGQSSPGQSNVKSPNHQMNGGVIGATGNPK